MSRLDNWKKKKEEETYRFRGDTKASLEAKKEMLEREKERLKIQNEIRESSKEIKRLKHPTQEKVRKGVTTAGSKIIRFTGETIQEGARVGSVTTRRIRKRKARSTGAKLRTRKTFIAPTGSDISLSGGIAKNQIIEDNMMTKDFFGTGSDTKQLLEDHKDLDLIGSSMKKKKQDYF